MVAVCEITDILYMIAPFPLPTSTSDADPFGGNEDMSSLPQNAQHGPASIVPGRLPKNGVLPLHEHAKAPESKPPV